MDIKKITSEEELRQLLKRQSKLFYDISNLDEQSLSKAQLLEKAAKITSYCWLYPDAINVAIEFDGEKYSDPSIKKSKWNFEVSSEVRENQPLTFRVFSSEKREFLDEEIELAQVIAHNLAAKVDRIRSRKELEEEQLLLDKAYKLAHIGTWEYDMINDELHWSEVTKEVHGFGPDYMPDVESTVMLFKEGYNRDTFAKAAEDAIERNIPFDVELKIVSGKGDERWIRATGEPEFNTDGVCVRFYGISQNVTDRRQAEEDLELNERRFKALVQDGMDMIAILDEEANYKYVSPASAKVLGMSPEFFSERNAFDFIHEDDTERIHKQFSSLSYRESTGLKPFRFLNADDEWRWLEATVTNLSEDPAVKGYVVNSRDVTERQLQHEKILDSLKEKETLLAEIHHRVKNNLSVLTGLLQLQAAKENNEEVLERLFDSVARIHTMASIHEQLYKSNNFSSIELGDRIRLLALNIKKSFQLDTEVELNFQCEPLDVSVSRALPCSLIVNEILTNIFKHAFKGRDEGKITVILTQTDINNYMKLAIIDDGIGIPKNFNPKESDSLGLTLVHMLSEQIKAEYYFENLDKGTAFNLLFKSN